MATVEQYAQWLVDNKAQKGSEDYQVVAEAFKKLDTPAPVVEPEETSILRLSYLKKQNKLRVSVSVKSVGMYKTSLLPTKPTRAPIQTL